MILPYWVNEKTCIHLEHNIIHIIYPYYRKGSVPFCPRTLFHGDSPWNIYYSMEHTLGNKLSKCSILIFQMRKLRSRKMALKATGVLIWVCMKIALYHFPFSHHIKVNLGVSYLKQNWQLQLSRWASSYDVLSE